METPSKFTATYIEFIPTEADVAADLAATRERAADGDLGTLVTALEGRAEAKGFDIALRLEGGGWVGSGRSGTEYRGDLRHVLVDLLGD